MTMSDANLTLIFKGQSVNNGDIDVRDLAPALLSVGELIQAANNVINGNKAQIAVKVNATSKGSFEVDISIIQSLLEAAKAFLDFSEDNKDGIAAAKDLYDMIFGASAGALTLGGGLYALIKFLKGRKPDKIEQKGGDVYVHIGDIHFITTPNAIKLATDIEVRKQAKKSLEALSKDGIDTIKIKGHSDNEISLTKADVPYFDYTETEEELSDEVRNMTLQIISLSFKEDNKWRVTDGGDPFSAIIEDIDFLNKIAKNEIAFSKGDYLICEVREQQTRSSAGLKKERSIIKVLDHKAAAQQLRLI